MKWKKRGLLYCPDGTKEWAKTHAVSPTYLSLANNIGCVYFSSRDEKGRSHIHSIYVEIIGNDIKIINESKKPVLSYGKAGTFHEHGVTASSVIRIDNLIYMYYTGWSLGVEGKFYLSIGLCESQNNGDDFIRVSEGPILTRSKIDYYTVGSLVVINDGGQFKMWYASGKCWDNKIKTYHTNIKFAHSNNGIDWITEGNVCIDAMNEREYYFGRPYVIKDGDVYKMFYSYRSSERSDNYRIGYAESLDGINWVRKDDEVGIDVSDDGWDSEMICFASVFDHGGVRFMLYNGNGYGKTGIGYAVLEDK